MPPVRMTSPDGTTIDVAPEDMQVFADRGYTEQSNAAHASEIVGQARDEFYSSPSNKARALIAAGFRGASLGGTDVLARAAGYSDELEALREANPITSFAGELGGALATGHLPTPASAVMRLGSRIGEAAEGASLLTRIGRAGAGAAVEGGLFGAGSGVSDLALSKDPVTLERAISTIGSSALFGAGTGGVIGAAGAGAGAALRRGKQALDEVAAKAAGASDLAGDLAALDAKGLRAAEKAERETLRTTERTELESLKVAEKTELDTIEATRVTQRKDVADEIKAFRRELKDQKHFLTTKDVELPAVEGMPGASEIGARAAKSTRALDRLLDNPIALAAKPTRALEALQQHESAMTDLLARADDLRTVFRADTSGTRAAALETIPAALEKNRELQKKLIGLSAKPSSTKLEEILARRADIQSGALRTSQRLDDIAATRDFVAGAKPSMIGNMVGGTAFGAVAGAVGSIPILGQIPGVAALAGGAAAKLVSGGIGKALTKQAARTSKAIGAFLSVGAKAAPVAPVLASKVLASLRFGPSQGAQTGSDMAQSYKARVAEIKAQTQYDQTGRAVMRPDARTKVFENLAAVRAGDPVAADRMETLAARRLEALANQIPRRPDLGGVSTGPDRWQPSDMEMRAFARFAHAVEDPIGIVERLAAGTVTPEDATAMKQVYPEMYQQIQTEIMAKLPTLRATLPFQRRLALSIFSGVPVDSSMNPQILSQLQSSFTDEPGSEGGTQAPMPQPQFGSVKNQEATPSQTRQGVTS